MTQWPSGNLVYRALTKVFGRMSETTLTPAPASGALFDDDGDRVGGRVAWPTARRDPSVQREEVARAPEPAEEPGASMTLDIDPLDLVDPARFARDGYPHHVWTRLAGRGPGGLLRAAGSSAVLGHHQACRPHPGRLPAADLLERQGHHAGPGR